MRLNINLATQPYEDARRFTIVWGGGLLLLAALTAGVVLVTISSWRTATQINQHIATQRAQLARLDEQQQRDLAILNMPANRDVKERSQFLNTLIRRKQFSWTQVFASLEKLMPGRLHVVAITPQLTEEDQILVRLRVAGDTRDKAIELVRNLEGSQSFRFAQVLSETVTDARGGPDGGVIFEITAIYVPNAQPPAEEQREGSGD